MPNRIIVTVDDAFVGRIDQVAQNLRRAGMTIDQVLSATGAITGSIAAGKLGAVRRLPGVASVEPDSEFRIPPPESEIQ